jgi:hypothetical protein
VIEPGRARIRRGLLDRAPRAPAASPHAAPSTPPCGAFHHREGREHRGNRIRHTCPACGRASSPCAIRIGVRLAKVGPALPAFPRRAPPAAAAANERSAGEMQRVRRVRSRFIAGLFDLRSKEVAMLYPRLRLVGIDQKYVPLCAGPQVSGPSAPGRNGRPGKIAVNRRRWCVRIRHDSDIAVRLTFSGSLRAANARDGARQRYHVVRAG